MRMISASADIIERAELDAAGPDECVSFFLAEPRGQDLRLVDVRAMGPDDFDGRSDARVRLTDSVDPSSSRGRGIGA
jgi:hypothetical protein